MEVSFEGGEIELEEGRGDSEEKNGGGGAELNGMEKIQEDLTKAELEMRKRGKGQSKDPVRFFPPEPSFFKLEH